jgi:membrane-bound metal-dependent hydrolase YbcI (DUF457 family)
MANFRTHITASTLLGVGYGAVGYTYGVPLSSCLVAGGLCSVAGMLPDLDSDSGVPVRELLALVSAVVPTLMIPRFQQMGLNPEQMVLAAAIIYLLVRFGVGGIFKRYTVHRGMWHSLPAAATAGLIAFLLTEGTDLPVRLFKSAAVLIGFVSHLCLDEFWSVQVRRGRLRIKRTLGTALKLWTTRSLWANVSVYGKLAVLVAVVIGDHALMEQIRVQYPELRDSPQQWLRQAAEDEPPWLGIERQARPWLDPPLRGPMETDVPRPNGEWTGNPSDERTRTAQTRRTSGR